MINQDKILSDILEAIKENDLTRRELAEMGYTNNICSVCYDPLCVGEYSHYDDPD